MNPSYSEFKFPQIKANPWSKLFRQRTDKDAIDLISKILVYNPERRLKPFEAMLHSYFDVLRDKDTTLPNKAPLPDLFNFTKEERVVAEEATIDSLIPDWYKEK